MKELVTDEVLDWLVRAERRIGVTEAEARLRQWFRPWVRREVAVCIHRWTLRGPDWRGGGLAEVIEEALHFGVLRYFYRQTRRYLDGGSRPQATPAFVRRLVSQFVIDECLGKSLIRRSPACRTSAPAFRLVPLADLDADAAPPGEAPFECVELRIAVDNALARLGEPAATLWRLYLAHLEAGLSESEALRRIAPQVDLTPRQVESRLRATRPRIQALLIRGRHWVLGVGRWVQNQTKS